MPTERQSERMRADTRGDRIIEPLAFLSGSFYPVSFLPSTRKILGPAQRPHPLWQKEIQRKRKTPSKIASLCFTAPPSAEPTAACFAAPPARWRSNGGRMLSAPTRKTCRILSFLTSSQTGEKSCQDDKISHRCAHRFGMTEE